MHSTEEERGRAREPAACLTLSVASWISRSAAVGLLAARSQSPSVCARVRVGVSE